MAPVLAVALVSRPRAALGWGMLGGFVFFLGLLRWLNFTFRTYSAIPWPLTWLPTMLLAAYCALWIALVAAAVSAIGARSRGWALAAAPFLWVAAEWGRGHLMGGFPWGLLGYSQSARLPVIQIAELGGVYAVSLVVLAVNAALAGCATLAPARAALGLGLAAVLVTGTLGFGWARLGEPPPAAGPRVALVQPSIEQPLKWDERFAQATVDLYVGLTRGVGRGQADLIVWPETAAPTALRRDPGLLAGLTGLADAVDTPLVVGSIDVLGTPPRLTNSAFLLTERGIEGRYDKIHLVPFGEYVPLSGLIGFVRGWAEFISDMEPGSRTVVFPGPPAPFGIVICYEGIFPDLFREFVRGGARVMINMTNDGWFGRTTGPAQHLAMYPLRAVEHRTALVRAANTGISAFIAPTGAVTRTLGLFERGVLAQRVPLRERTTLYTRHGDWLAYGSLGVSALALGAAVAARRAA
jgi:apolipoprotein N-acyltransferase